MATRHMHPRVRICFRRICLGFLFSALTTGARHWVLVLFSVIPVSAFAQPEPFAEVLQRKLDAYYRTNTPITIDMIFNQPGYVPGDTAWFSLWLTTERGGLPLTDRHVVYVNVLNATGERVLKEKILLNSGRGSSQLVIPESLPAGIYTVVSWTDWMKNGHPDMYSYKELVIKGERNFIHSPMPLAAYVEGGNFVAGALNRIVVTGPPATMVSLHAPQQLLQTLELDAQGYGEMDIKAKSGVRYTLSGAGAKTEMVPVDDAVAMGLNFNDSAATFTVKLQSPTHRKSSHLTIMWRGRIVYAALVSFSHDQAMITIPKKNLPEGLMLLTVFDEQKTVLAERLFTAHDTPGVQVQADRSIVHARDHVPVSISAPGLARTSVTVSIYAADIFPDSTKDSWALTGRLPRGGLDFNIDPSWSLRQWNTFLITQRWKRFQWPDVWNESAASLHTSSPYLSLKGRLLFQENRSSFDSLRITFFFRKEARVYEQYVSPSGEFDFPLVFDFDDVEEVIYAVDRRGRIIRNATVHLDEEVSPSLSFRNFNRTSSVDRYFLFSHLREETRKAYWNYDLMAAEEIADPNEKVEDELTSADVTVKLDDYLVFPTMEETLREVIPKLQHRWRGHQHSVRVYLTEPDILANDDPLYFIDGVLTDDTDYFMGLNPGNVAIIKIVSNQRNLQAMGILGRNGIVLVTTKAGDAGAHTPPSRKSFTVLGFTRPVEFSNNANLSARTPLLRSSAYFNSMLTLDSSGSGQLEFVAPDNVGMFRIEVSGLTRQGTGFTSFSTMRVIRPTTSP